jgi:hypothetical protein
MAGFYRPRHPERTVLYRVLSHHFERFLAEYEDRFEREYGFFRPIVSSWEIHRAEQKFVASWKKETYPYLETYR